MQSETANARSAEPAKKRSHLLQVQREAKNARICCRFIVRRGHGDPPHASAATQATHPMPQLCGQITLFKMARIVEKSTTCVEISCQS